MRSFRAIGHTGGMSTELDLAWLDPSCRDLTRRTADGLGSGLSRAMAQRLGVDVIIVRVAFVVLALSAGLGLALYGWGTLLTRGPQGSRPIDALLPSFRTWSLGSQKAAVIIMTLIFTFVVAASTPLPWGAGFLLLGAVIVVRRRALRGFRFPEPTGQELSVDAQLVAWRSRLEAAAGTTVTPCQSWTSTAPLSARRPPCPGPDARGWRVSHCWPPGAASARSLTSWRGSPMWSPSRPAWSRPAPRPSSSRW